MINFAEKKTKLMKSQNIIAALLFTLLLASCSSTHKQVQYFQGVENYSSANLSKLSPIKDPVIMPGDLLNIQVSGTSPEALAPFNRGSYVTAEGEIRSLNNQNLASGAGVESSTLYYLVDPEGYIEMPLIGKIRAAGLEKGQLAENIADDIAPKYVKEKPFVDIRIMNFHVTLIGAVNQSGIVSSDNERMNLVEALAKSGDLNIQGERRTVKIIRTNSDGSREVAELDLTDPETLNSPYFNLRQNDIIYVVPNKTARQDAWHMPSTFSNSLAIIGGLSAVAALVVSIINISK